MLCLRHVEYPEICLALAQMRAQYRNCRYERLSLGGGPRALLCPVLTPLQGMQGFRVRVRPAGRPG